jgi:uncharacterized membrane protein YkvA (DUF1232 family)
MLIIKLLARKRRNPIESFAWRRHLGTWYPTQFRIKGLTAQLLALEQFTRTAPGQTDETIASVSRTISDAVHCKGFPVRQIRQWIWLGSQYRLHAKDCDDVATVCGASLAFLNQSIRKPMDDELIRDLNWVLETSVQRICALLDQKSLRSYLSATEIESVELLLAQYMHDAEFVEKTVRDQISGQMRELGVFSESGQFVSIRNKIEILFDASQRDTEEGKIARASLLYLADTHDVVGDASGLLGLVDDIYVIEWAFAAVEQQTRCLPILDRLLEDYPYIADLALIGDPLVPLDLYSQYVCTMVLSSTFGTRNSRILIMRDSGPYALLGAFFAAVEAARRQAKLDLDRLANWTVGQHITVSDSGFSFNAIYLGETFVGHDRRIKLGVRNSATLTVPTELVPYMSTSLQTHKRLANGKDFSVWLKGRHADPFINLIGSGRRRVGGQDCVLILGPSQKNKLYLNDIRPLATSLGSLVGFRYVKADGSYEDLGGSSTDSPHIFACSSADIAYDLIRKPPSHVGNWHVIVDGPRYARALHAMLTSDGISNNPQLCIIAELYDREYSRELLQLGYEALYLEDIDVELPWEIPKIPPENGGNLAAATTRQGSHWQSVVRTKILNHSFLEAVNGWLHDINVGRGRDETSSHLEMAVTAFLRDALSQPILDAQRRKSLQAHADTILAQAKIQRAYSDAAAKLTAIFDGVSKLGLPAIDRSQEICTQLAEGIPGERTAIVCRSSAIASVCRDLTSQTPELSGVRWLTIETVRRDAPFDTLIVPGWLDRLSMRELSFNGYARRLDFLLFPFEGDWTERTVAATNKWERRVEGASANTFKHISAELFAGRRREGIWVQQLDARLASTRDIEVPESADEISDKSEIELADDLAVASIRRSLNGGHKQPTAKAKLVLFELPGSFALLPPHGRVIVLADGNGAIPNQTPQPIDAENFLLRKVGTLEVGFLLALPINNDRDFIDARADLILRDASRTRHLSSLWREALKRFLNQPGRTLNDIARKFAEIGVHRDVTTFRSWILGTSTIAPRGFREVIPKIVAITNDQILSENLSIVLNSIEIIYKARSEAAEAIVKEVFSGDIDLDADEVSLGSGSSRYAIRRIRSIEGMLDVPFDMIGKARSFTDVSFQSGPTNPLLQESAVA